MNRKSLIDLIGILLLLMVVLVGYKLSPLLLPKSDRTVWPDPACNLHRGPCSVEFDGARLSFSLSPRPIPMAAPIVAEVRLTGMQAERVEVDFAGLDMNMGLNRSALAQQGDGRFAVETTLPVCVTGDMNWQATVLVERAQERIAIPFQFPAHAAGTTGG